VVLIRLLIRKLKQIIQWLRMSSMNRTTDQWVLGTKDVSAFGRTIFQKSVIIADPNKSTMKLWTYQASHCKLEPTPNRFSVSLSWSSFSSTIDCNG